MRSMKQTGALISLLLFMLCTSLCLAQQTHITFAYNRAWLRFTGIDNWEFKPIQVGDKFGFSTGPATGAWGITKPSGEVEISPLFDKVCRFEKGFAAVKNRGCWGVINPSATYVVEPAFDKVWSPQNNKDTEELVMRFSGDGVDPDDLYESDPLEDWTNGFKAGVFPLQKNARWHLIDSSGNQIGSTTWERMLPMNSDRVAVFADKLWGYLGSDGRLAIKPQFHEAKSFREGLAPVRRANLWGYVDVSGSMVIPEKFERADDFASGTAIIVASGSFGVIDKTGNYLVKPEYSYINAHENPELLCVYTAFEAGIFHRSCGWVLPAIYDSFSVCPDGSILANLDGKQGLFDANGKILLPLSETKISPLGGVYLLSETEKGLAVYDTHSRQLKEFDYQKINSFSDGLAAFKSRDGLWGFLDRDLKEAIPARFVWVSGFIDGQAAAEMAEGTMIISRDGRPAKKPDVAVRNIPKHDYGWRYARFHNRLGIQDAEGNWRLRPEYRQIRVFSTGVMLAQRDKTWELITAEKPQGTGMTFKDAGNVSENRCWVQSDKGCGYLDGDGKMVIECRYEKAYDFKNGIAAVRGNKLWGFIDAAGKELLPHIYTDVQHQEDGTYIVFEGNKKGLVLTDGTFEPAEAEPLPPELEPQKEE